MNKWRIARNITFSVLIIFILVFVRIGISFIFDNGIYPDDHYGITKIEAYGLLCYIFLIFSAIPMLVDIIILIVSVVKLRKLK